jgi:hypothetical protein
MEMASSTIINLGSSVQWRDLIPDINGDVGWLNISRYGTSDLTSSDQFLTFSEGCHEEVRPCNIPGYYVLLEFGKRRSEVLTRGWGWVLAFGWGRKQWW